MVPVRDTSIGRPLFNSHPTFECPAIASCERPKLTADSTGRRRQHDPRPPGRHRDDIVGLYCGRSSMPPLE
ncbi:hypothetical protein CVS37_25045 [Burkholderia lata]|nr:hypothetical protein CVS37_25045 [Burkholderia lata]